MSRFADVCKSRCSHLVHVHRKRQKGRTHVRLATIHLLFTSMYNERYVPRFSLAADSRDPANARVTISITNNNPVMFVPSIHFDRRNAIDNHRSAFFFFTISAFLDSRLPAMREKRRRERRRFFSGSTEWKRFPDY